MCLERSTTWCSNSVHWKSVWVEKQTKWKRKIKSERGRQREHIELNGNETSGEQFTMQNQFSVSNNWWAWGMHNYQSVVASFTTLLVDRCVFLLLFFKPTSSNNGNEKLSLLCHKNRYVFSVLFSLFILINVVVFTPSAYVTCICILMWSVFRRKNSHTHSMLSFQVAREMYFSMIRPAPVISLFMF